MENIDFYNIAILGDSKQSSFEDLCMHLCCRELKVSSIDSYKNQPGIETEPFLVKKERVGFQAKYFEARYEWKQIKHSLLGSENKKTKSKKLDLRFPDNVFKRYALTKIHIYSNKEKTLSGRNKTEAEKLIDKLARNHNCKIVYKCQKALQVDLAKPANKDLAQLYFGISDELGLIEKTIPPQTLTFLSSTEFLSIPTCDNHGNQISKIDSHVLQNTPDIYLLLGNPGSGKSILIRKLFQQLSGLDQKSQTKRVNLLTKHKMLPVLVNLKDCAFENIENLIRNIKSDFNITESSLGFFYLFDGLDELSEEKVELVISYIHKITLTENNSKVLISCRKSNINRKRLINYFSTIHEITIQDLAILDIDKYFKGKNDPKKYLLLNKLKKNNLTLLTEVKDILLADLLWQTIERLDDNSTVIDLLGEKVDLLLEKPDHINSLNSLNLLNPKKDKVIELLQKISFEYHDKRRNKFQFRFYVSDLQDLILTLLPNIDYRSANQIINYISDLFFDTYEASPTDVSETYIFRHRRYQEYFFAQRLKQEYEKNPNILRQLKVISSKDFFNDLFLPYLRSEYISERNIQGLVGLNLIDVYLGSHSGFGVDDNDYLSSSEFLGNLLSQNEEVYEELIGDTDLNMEARFFINIDSVNSLIQEINNRKNEKHLYKLEDELKELWNNDLPSVLHYSALFWQFGKKAFSNKLQKNFSDVMKNLEASNVFDIIESDFKDPYWNSFDDFMYLRLIIKQESPIDILNGQVRKNYENFRNEDSYSYRESGKERLINTFFRTVFRLEPDSIFAVFNALDDEEKIQFLPLFVSSNGYETLNSNEELFGNVKKYTRKVESDDFEYKLYIIALKKLFKIRIKKSELQETEEEWEKIRSERPMDWGFRGYEKRFAICSHILDKFNFDKFLKPQTGHAFRYYNDQGLYAALYEGLLRISLGLDAAENVIGNFIKYINFYYEGRDSHNYLTNEISKTLAVIFSKVSNTYLLRPFIDILNKYDQRYFNLYLFYLHLHKTSPSTFNKLVTTNDLRFISELIANWKDEYNEYVDMCFSLGRMLSHIDSRNAKEYTYKGINDGILRHGWRKDTLVSYSLVDSLEDLWSIGADSKDNLIKYTTTVFDLTRKVVDITDGKGTLRGPYNLLRLISNYDTKHTEYLFNQLDEYSGERNLALAIVINSKIKFGYDLDQIYDDFKKFISYYGYREGTDPEYFDHQILCLLNITESHLYTGEEKQEAFEKCRSLIGEATTEQNIQILKDDSYRKQKEYYNSLCNINDLDDYFEIKDQDITDDKEKTNIELVNSVNKAKSVQDIDSIYKKLIDYQEDVTMSSRDSWELLLSKTQEICGNIDWFIKLLKEHHYPHSDWYSRHSKYFHLALSVALSDINTRDQIFVYLKDNTGHGGFGNLIKAFSVNNDKTMCLKLFDSFLKLCNLLVH